MSSPHPITPPNKLPIMFAVTLFYLFASSVMAQSTNAVKFSWLPNSEPEVTGYKIYFGETAGGPYPNEIDVGKPAPVDGRIQGEVTGLECQKTYYFVCRAYDAQGQESEDSAPVMVRLDIPGQTTGLVIVPAQ